MKTKIKCLLVMLFVTTAIFAQIQLPDWSMFRPNTSGANADFTGGSPMVTPTSQLPVATDDAGNALLEYRATNSWYDCNNALQFYVVSAAGKTYIYDPAGVKYTHLGMPSLNHVATAGNEITIVPVPNSCGYKFHVIVGGCIIEIHIYTKQIFSVTSFSSGFIFNPVASKLEFPHAVKYTPAGYRVYFIYGFRTLNYKEVTFNAASFTITAGTPRNLMGTVGYGPSGMTFSDVFSEMEISPDGSLLLFADDAWLRVHDVNNLLWNWRTLFAPPNTPPPSPTQHLAGLEWASNSTRIFYTIYDPANPSRDGIYYRDYPVSSTYIFVPGSAAFSHSQIEMGRDGNLYVAKADGLWRINNSTGAVSSMSITPVGGPAPLISNEGNPAGVTNSSIYTLPDQIDGSLPSNGPTVCVTPPVTSPLFSITICEGQSAIMDASVLDAMLGGYGGFYIWNPDDGTSTNGSLVTVTPSASTNYNATFISNTGCVGIKNFQVNVIPGPLATHQDHHVCPNPGTVPLTSNCGPGETTEWYKGNMLVGTGPNYTVASFTGALDYTAVCKNSSGCIVSRVIHHIIIGNPPLVITNSPFVLCYGIGLTIANPLCNPGGSGSWESHPNLSLIPIGAFVETFVNGTYRYTCLDANGCPEFIYEYDIEVLPPLHTYTDIYVCQSAQVDLSNAAGGCNGVWKNDATQQTTPSIFTATVSGSYTSLCRGSNGCVTIKHVTVNVGTPPNDEYMATTICEGGALDLYGVFSATVSTVNCNWLDPNGNPVSNPSNFNPTLPGTYTSVCEDIYGCTFNRTLDLTITPAPVNSFGVQVCLGGTVDLSQYAPPGMNNCTYNLIIAYYPNGEPELVPISPSFPAELIGTKFYRITCTDANGCSYHTDIAVTIPPVPVTGVAVLACDGDEINLGDYIDQGLFDCSFNRIIAYDKHGNPVLQQIMPTFTADHTVPNTYRVICVDANGCIHYTDIELEVHPHVYHNLEINVDCGTILDWNNYPNPCTGAPDWGVDMGGGMIGYPNAGPIFSNMHLIGLNSSDPCCHATLTINVTPPVVKNISICTNGPFDIVAGVFDCDHEEYAFWTLNGVPFEFQNVIWEQGTYQIVCGCTITNLEVTFDPLCLYPDYECLLGGDAQLVSYCPNGGTPTWYLDGVYIGAGSTINVSAEGIYTCLCKDGSGNVLSSRAYIVHDCNPPRMANPSLNEVGPAQNMTVFPNPSTGVFNLTIDNFNGLPHTLEITDVLGRVIYRKENITTMPMEIDLSAESKGMFTVRVFNGETVYSSRIIVE
jgi:hypothetical protein